MRENLRNTYIYMYVYIHICCKYIYIYIYILSFFDGKEEWMEKVDYVKGLKRNGDNFYVTTSSST